MSDHDSDRRRWTNTRIEREVDPHRSRWLYGGLMALLIAVLPAVAWVLHQNECLRLSYELNSVRSDCERLQEHGRRVAVKRAELESLARVETWARKHGGLQLPDAESVVVVRPVDSPAAELLAGISSNEPAEVR